MSSRSFIPHSISVSSTANSVTLTCEQCRRTRHLLLPMEITVFVGLVKAFGVLHYRCRPAAEPDAAPNEEANP